ncbi:hypothetical protein [Altericista sp. CCNU0014]|uniref:hypothetical protein n=1 Tax=Altericista sp. CCNU0014 TaxID=3082949 RepID=UPI00384F192E
MGWVMVCGGIVILLCAFLWQTSRRAQKGNLGKVIDYSAQNRGSRRQQWQNDSASEVKLERLVGAKTADRLIVSLLLDHPRRSRAWCADKALQDLMRDRQRG